MRTSILFLIFVLFSSLTPQEIIHPLGDYAMINGAKIWYEIEGNGKPLVLIPGGPGSTHYFHPYFSVMADSFHVIYFDAFGRGKSDTAKDPKEYTFARDVEDLEGLRKALHIDKMLLLGHSYGGMVAQAYALKYPENVEKLILSNTLFNAEMWQANNDNCNYEIRNQYPEIWDSLMVLRAQGKHSGDKEHQALYGTVPSGLFYYYNAGRANDKGINSGINPKVYYSIAGYDADFLIGGDMSAIDFRTSLKDLKMPVLIMAGRFDRVALPRFSVQFKKYAPQAKFVMFEKSGHNPFLEQPEEYFKTLRDFLR